MVSGSKSRRTALRVSGLVLFVGAVVATGVLAPDLIGYMRFSRAVEQQAVIDETRGGPWPQLFQVCAPCHGATGTSLNSNYPDLAGQPATYLAEQLKAFAKGSRSDPAMSPLAAALSEKEIETLSRYFSIQRNEVDSSFNIDPDQVAEGEALIEREGCTACHGEKLGGMDTFPGLAGQSAPYLSNQLRAYQSDVRVDPSGAMAPIARALSSDEIEAIAHYLNSLTPSAPQ